MRFFVVLALLLLAALPLWQLTGSSVVPVPVVQSATGAGVSEATMQLHLKFAHAPQMFQLLYLGKPVWSPAVKGAATFQTELAIPFPKEGVDLELKVQWPEGTPETAVRLDLKTPDGTSLHKTIWGRGEIDEVLTFP